MTGRTRYFLVGSSLVLVVGVCTGLVAYYGSSLPGRLSPLGPALDYVPSTTAALAFADVRDIMDSEFRQKLREVLPVGHGRDELLEATGIDVEQDVDSVLVAFAPEGSPVVFVRGKFDPVDLGRRAVEHGARAETYRGKTFFVSLLGDSKPAGTDARLAHESAAMAVLETDLLVFGSEPLVKAAIDTAEANTDITRNTQLMSLVNDVDGDGNAWVVADVASLSRGATGVASTLQERVPSLERFAVSARVDRAVNARLRAQTADAKSANDLLAMVNGLVAAGRILGGSQPGVSAVFDSVQASGSGDTVEVSVSVPAELLERLGNAANLLRPRTSPAK